MISIKSIDWIREKGEISALPMFGGRLTFCKITEVTGDEPGEDGHRTLIYNPDGTLAKNYIMCFIYADGTSKFIANGSDLSSLCGFEEEYKKILNDWMLGLNGAGSGIPITVTPVEADGVETLVFGNLYEYYREMEDEERNMEYQRYLDSCSKDDAALSKEAWSNTFMTSYQKLTRAYADIGGNCDRDMYIRSVMAKLGGIIQKRYNQIHFEEVADEVAELISDIRYFNDNGEIVMLSVTALENFISRVKDRIRIGGDVKSTVDPKSAYRNF